MNHEKLLNVQKQHLAASNVDVFITTGDRLIKKMRQIDTLPTMLPGEAIANYAEWRRSGLPDMSIEQIAAAANQFSSLLNQP